MIEDDVQSSEFSVAELIRFLWSVRGWMAAGVIVGLVIAGIGLGLTKLATFETDMQYVIEFRFDGRAEDRYPNGTPFSVADIIAPAVLADVYESQNLSEQGISLREFQTAVSVAPFAPQRRLIIERYSQVQARNITTAEIREAQEALTRELAAASTRYAMVTLAQSRLGLPAARAAAVMSEIVRTWERTAIESRGVLQIDIRPLDPRVFDESNVAGLERLPALQYIGRNLESMIAFVDKIIQLPGGNQVRDAETGASAAGLRSELERSATQLSVLPAGWGDSPGTGSPETLGLPLGLYSDRLFDPAQIENLDYLIAADLLRERIGLVRDNVRRILATPYGEVAVDPETQLASRDVERLLFELENFSLKQLTSPILSLGISKNPEILNIYYQTRLQELRRQKDTLASKAQILEQANQNYQGLIGGSGSPESGTPGAGFPGAGPSSTVIPQLGDAFLDRIIGLAQKGGDTEFRQNMLENTVSYQQQAADIDEEIRRISDYVVAFTKPLSERDYDPRLVQQATQDIENQLPLLMSQLKDYTDITRRIAYRLRLAQDLRSIVATEAGGAPALEVDFYLRGANEIASVEIKELLAQFRKQAESANRMYEVINTQALGTYMRLFRAASEPQSVRPPLISRMDALVIALSALIGFAVGGLVGFFRAPAFRRMTRDPAS